MTETSKPNIIVIYDDQHRGQDIGVAGNDQIQTPNLDRLAAEGLYLPHTFSNSPVTCLAHSVLVTGKYPHKSGVRENDLRIPAQPSLASELNAAGYSTGYIGKWHLDGGLRKPGFVPKERRLGFEWWAANECNHNYFDTEYFRDDPEPIKMTKYEPIELTDLAIEFLHEHEKKSPFCLIVAFSPPHTPYIAPENYMAMYPPEGILFRPNFVAGTEKQRGKKTMILGAQEYQGYYAAITCIDEQVGRIMKAVDEKGIADDTLIIFTSDHGDMLGSHGMIDKGKPHEESLCVPGIFRYPRRIQPGQVKDAIFSWVNIMPTLLSIGGARIPDGVQGMDLSNVLFDPAADGPESAYIQMTMVHAQSVPEGWRGVRTKRYTYARFEEKQWVLFDNQEDPYQMKNLVDDPGARKIRDELEQLTMDYMKKTEDKWIYNVPKRVKMWHDPVEKHEEILNAAYREMGKEPPQPVVHLTL